MPRRARALPSASRTLTPLLIVDGASKAITFYKKAFGARERTRHACPDSGKLLHAQLTLGDSILMLADEFPQMGATAPHGVRQAASMHLYVDDCDATFKRAIKAGGRQLTPVSDQFYGDRSGTLKDPFGHVWTVSTHKQDLTDAEVKRRIRAEFSSHPRSAPRAH